MRSQCASLSSPSPTNARIRPVAALRDWTRVKGTGSPIGNAPAGNVVSSDDSPSPAATIARISPVVMQLELPIVVAPLSLVPALAAPSLEGDGFAARVLSGLKSPREVSVTVVMTRDPSGPARFASLATTLHVLEWGAAAAIAATGSPPNPGWRVVACALVALLSIQRVRRGHAARLPSPEASLAPPAARGAVEPQRLKPARTFAAAASDTLREPVSAVIAVSREGTVLLVDSDPASQSQVAGLLGAQSYTVTIAPDARTAAQLAMTAARSGEPFDVLLIAMQMAESDSYAAVRDLRARGYKGSIVALTGPVPKREREACLEAGCDEYLIKPVTRPVLVAVLRESIEAARATLENADTCTGKRTLPHSDEPLSSELEDDPDVGDLVVEFVRVLGKRASELAEALARKDLATITRLAHQVKGAAGATGSRRSPSKPRTSSVPWRAPVTSAPSARRSSRSARCASAQSLQPRARGRGWGSRARLDYPCFSQTLVVQMRPKPLRRSAVRRGMRTCRECDEEMIPSTRSIRVFSAQERTTPLRVEASECPKCGRMAPLDGAVENALRMLDHAAPMAG